MSQNAYLILENGTYFEGKAFGAEKETLGELVFTTAMTGYLETITDPSHYGQVVLQTFPLIGNYGVISSDKESDAPTVNAYIVRNWCQAPSNFRCEGDLDTFLKNTNVPGIYDIDTRALTRIIREKGVMNCKVTYTLDNLDKDIEETKNYKVENPVAKVTSTEIKVIESETHDYKVTVVNYGVKNSICEALVSRGCDVTVVPSTATADEIAATNPDGILLSNGPGNPTDNVEAINQLKALCEKKIPTFGVCLGHQLLALSQGATSSKLNHGHRGEAQPVKEVKTGRVYPTSQNHGYIINSDSIPENATEIYVNANDATCEGIEYTNMPAFSVQFVPGSCGGPCDTAFVFDRFIEMMKNNK